MDREKAGAIIALIGLAAVIVGLIADVRAFRNR
jgi:hypothetical protein